MQVMSPPGSLMAAQDLFQLNSFQLQHSTPWVTMELESLLQGPWNHAEHVEIAKAVGVAPWEASDERKVKKAYHERVSGPTGRAREASGPSNAHLILPRPPPLSLRLAT